MRLRKGQAARCIGLATLVAALVTITSRGSGSTFIATPHGSADYLDTGQELSSSSRSTATQGSDGNTASGLQGPITLPAPGRGPHWAELHAQLVAEVSAAENLEVLTISLDPRPCHVKRALHLMHLPPKCVWIPWDGRRL